MWYPDETSMPTRRRLLSGFQALEGQLGALCANVTVGLFLSQKKEALQSPPEGAVQLLRASAER